jgi:two-component system sensor histidine kinase YesM
MYKQKIMNQQSELKQLQSQINPHFLYNSFFTINTMARMQDENLVKFSHYLGVYFQYITRNASPYVPLKEEVEHARIYANIQRIRFSKRLDIQFEELPEPYAQRTIPRLMLQPILENAFEYVVEKQQMKGEIRVSFVPDGEMLSVVVEDNGKMLTDQKLQQMQQLLHTDTFETMETTGMINIHRRIQLIYGRDNNIGLTLNRSGLGGLKVTLKIGGVEYVSIADRG